jgi:hypothetical protein
MIANAAISSTQNKKRPFMPFIGKMMFLQEARSRDELRLGGGPADAPCLRTSNNSVVVDGCVSSKGEWREH